MRKIRKHHHAEFKARGTLVAMREGTMIVELASRYGIHATIIH